MLLIGGDGNWRKLDVSFTLVLLLMKGRMTLTIADNWTTAVDSQEGAARALINDKKRLC